MDLESPQVCALHGGQRPGITKDAIAQSSQEYVEPTRTAVNQYHWEGKRILIAASGIHCTVEPEDQPQNNLQRSTPARKAHAPDTHATGNHPQQLRCAAPPSRGPRASHEAGHRTVYDGHVAGRGCCGRSGGETGGEEEGAGGRRVVSRKERGRVHVAEGGGGGALERHRP